MELQRFRTPDNLPRLLSAESAAVKRGSGTIREVKMVDQWDDLFTKTSVAEGGTPSCCGYIVVAVAHLLAQHFPTPTLTLSELESAVSAVRDNTNIQSAMESVVHSIQSARQAVVDSNPDVFTNARERRKYMGELLSNGEVSGELMRRGCEGVHFVRHVGRVVGDGGAVKIEVKEEEPFADLNIFLDTPPPPQTDASAFARPSEPPADAAYVSTLLRPSEWVECYGDSLPVFAADGMGHFVVLKPVVITLPSGDEENCLLLFNSLPDNMLTRPFANCVYDMVFEHKSETNAPDTFVYKQPTDSDDGDGGFATCSGVVEAEPEGPAWAQDKLLTELVRGSGSVDDVVAAKKLLREIDPSEPPLKPGQCPRVEAEDAMLWARIQMGNLEGLQQLLGESPTLVDRLGTLTNNGLSPLVTACVVADDELAKVFLDAGADPDSSDNAGWTGLHHAALCDAPECVKLLLAAGADYTAESVDVERRLSGIPLYSPGGQQPLHVACSKQRTECALLLLDAGANPHTEDNDGSSALELALISGAQDIVERISPGTVVPSKEERQRLSDELELKRKRRFEAKSRRSKDSEVAAMESYAASAKYPELFEFDLETWCVPEFVTAFNAGPDALRAFAIQITEGVYVFPFLKDELASLLIEEVGRYEASGLPVRRPTNLNRRGTVISHAFKKSLNRLSEYVVSILANSLLGAGEGDGFVSQHTFVLQYTVGQDRGRSIHIDPSDVTLNVCLRAENVGGSQLFFHSLLPPFGSEAEQSTAVAYGETGKLGGVHEPTPCDECTASHTHEPTLAVLHLGRHIHGAHAITAGERWNMILWSRKYQADQA